MGLKRPERDVNYLPASSTEIKNKWSYTSTPQYTPSWRGQGQLLTIRLLANKFMEQSRSWSDNIAAGDKYIPLILWDPKIHHLHLFLSWIIWTRFTSSIASHQDPFEYYTPVTQHVKYIRTTTVLPFTLFTVILERNLCFFFFLSFFLSFLFKRTYISIQMFRLHANHRFIEGLATPYPLFVHLPSTVV